MRHAILLPATLAVALAITGCAPKEAALTEAKKAAIRQEVLQTVKPMWAACEAMDPATMGTYSQDGPDFGFATQDGKVYTFAEFSKSWSEMIGLFSSQKLVIRKETVIVLAPDAALYCWQGANDMVQKDGTVLRTDPMSGMYLFRKVGNAWKGTYFQESGPAGTRVKAAEPAKK